MSEKQPGARFIYDGACPFCAGFAMRLRLDKAVGGLEIVDARRGGPVVEAVIADGYDLDDGMVLEIGGRRWHGADCLNAMALMSGRVGWVNRLTALCFKSPRVAAIAYPWLRGLRNLALRVKGRGRIAEERDTLPGGISERR
jgi:hypothetical protein